MQAFEDFIRFLIVSVPHTYPPLKMLRGWFCTRPTRFLRCHPAVVFHVVLYCMCFLTIAVFHRKPVQGLKIYSQSFVYHLTGLFGTNIIGQLGW